jgi:hypothetical protein
LRVAWIEVCLIGPSNTFLAPMLGLLERPPRAHCAL